MRFPLKKCYHTAKICFLLMIVLALLSLFEHWRGGKRTATAHFSDPAEEEYEREILEDEARIIPELGEGGMAAQLTGEDKRLGEESEKKLAMNVYLSDRIPYNRTLKDYRNPACQRVVYDAELPSVSVIIIFHNEPYSVVVRTVWSVINSARRDNPWFKQANFVDMQSGRTMNLGYKGQDPSSPLVYLKEIILVDDNSTLPELKGKLSHYVRTRLPPDLIRILRLPDRQGLIIARIRGARSARGDVLIFLDAHCETGADWLRPLLQRIRHKRDAVITPVIDVIDQKTYSLQAAESFQVGGFTFMGHFTWIDVPEREKKRRGSNISPTWSPTMAGGLFAINREYYWELGAYDEQMGGWGGENLEMSFRIWQCGGTLETIPCSRVGHVFRSFHPYGLPAHTDTHGINTARMAEVWMDEYAELFYIHRPDLRKSNKIGDVTHRKVLREKLHCKSFQWYLDNIYKEKFVPVRDVFGYGRFSNPSSGLCLDTLQRNSAGVALGVYPCHRQLLATQYFSLSLTGQLRDEELCAELQYGNKDTETTGRRVVMASCRGSAGVARGQKWSYRPNGRLRHEESGLCLDAGRETGADVLAKLCGDEPTQKWLIDYSEENGFKASGDEEHNEQEQRLLKLRGQRRISRSLLSHEPSTVRRRGRKRHHKRRGSKRRRHDDRFILTLARTLMNGSEDHLEVDVHCKHRQLYPNNSFVRDLVTILNDKNIKVINNGRVFERNKVVSQGAAPSALRSEPGEGHPADQHHTTQDSPWPKRSQPVEPRRPPMGPAPAGRAPLAAAPRATKIIIEDFVEMTPAGEDLATARPVTKHKDKRHRLPSALLPDSSQTPPPPETREGAQQTNADKHARNAGGGSRVAASGWKDVEHNDEEMGDMTAAEPSAEDQPMVGSSAEGGEDWPPGEGRLNSTRILPLRRADCEHGQDCEHEQTQPRTHPRAPPQHTERKKKRPAHRVRPSPSLAELPARAASDRGQSAERWSERSERAGDVSEKPVKVVVKSNLTFNFGDEFFDWKKESEDITNILGELAIPGGHTPEPVELQAWIKLHKPHSGSDDLAPGRGEKRAPASNYIDKGARSPEDQISAGRGLADYAENSSSDSSGE